MKTRLIYSYLLSGHNMEYLHHLYQGALEDAGNQYVFAVPCEFEEKKGLMEWPASGRIRFHFFDDIRLGKGSLLVRAWRNAKHVGATIRKTKADEVILLSIIDFIPFLPFFVPRGIRVSGILYRIYLYYLSEMSWLQRLQDCIKYQVLVRTRAICRLFVLNDEVSTAELNRRWHTDKFRYLPDPFIPIQSTDLRNMRQELGIAADRTIVLHIGSITYGKGSDRIFDMIDRSSEKDLQSYVFLFAGVISPCIRKAFYKRLEQCRQKVEIIVRDKFLSYSDMGSLVYTADKVLLPYRRTGQSSGIIAYCAQLHTPVYVPAEGLIGNLVERYRIGLCVKDFKDIHSIGTTVQVDSFYCNDHTVENFYHTLLAF